MRNAKHKTNKPKETYFKQIQNKVTDRQPAGFTRSNLLLRH